MRMPGRTRSSTIQGGGQIYVGTSGWSYRSWSETVARGVPMKQRLRFFAARYSTLEVNGSFYRQIARATYQRWSEETPETFRFALKGHRFVTHYKRLRDCDDSVARLRDQAAGLGSKLAVVLWQLPGHLTYSEEGAAGEDRLDAFLEVLASRWPDTRHALEMRHRSWFREDVRDRLAAARVAACWSDAPDFPLWDVVTTDLVYVRLHGHTRKYASRYSAASLRGWAERARVEAAAGRNVHIYFDNDAESAAVLNADALSVALGSSSGEDRSKGSTAAALSE
jgi:uncharacterized protein YecE (DUF72 family)